MSFNGPPEPPKAENLSSKESAPDIDPYRAFEVLVERGVWSAEMEEELKTLLESHEEALYMIYLNYLEFGIADELANSDDESSRYERRLVDWLRDAFSEDSE